VAWSERANYQLMESKGCKALTENNSGNQDIGHAVLVGKVDKFCYLGDELHSDGGWRIQLRSLVLKKDDLDMLNVWMMPVGSVSL